jgi:CRISPR/Cas system CSM-associated protein Csm3 (group 7 of RAMP superfamily)
MSEIAFNIHLISDAEPGTGLGGEFVNDYVHRDLEGRATLPASHLKGLMRSRLADFAKARCWEGLEDRTFGCPGPSPQGAVEAGGIPSAFAISDAVAEDRETSRLVTRTSVDPQTGTAKNQTLRTTESIPKETRFYGKLFLLTAPGSPEDLAARLSLLAIPAVGGGRTRGSGLCVVSIQGETRSTGEILKQLDQSLKVPTPDLAEPRPAAPTKAGQTEQLLHLVFRATSPICVPETVTRGNMLKSGFSIPASAIQGAVLHRINRHDPELATACYESPLFRAWPLQPCGPADLDPDCLPAAFRVSLTHKAWKLVSPDYCSPDDFSDFAIEWKEQPSRSPLKACDGVLLRNHDGTVKLWKSAHMPRVLTTHGAQQDPQTPDGRNLYSIEAMAPLTWCGLLSLPEGAAQLLIDSLEQNPMISVGKGRSVRGMGTLTAHLLPANNPFWELKHPVLIAQSPLLLPDQPPSATTPFQDEVFELAQQWARQHGLPPVKDLWAAPGIRFGWNRRRLGAANPDGRLRACRVALPGAVIKFQGPLDPEPLRAALIAGCGGGRERGFGSLTAHPGVASQLYHVPPKVRQLQPEPESQAVQDVLELYRAQKRAGIPLPSPSQIADLQQRLLKSGRGDALEYLKTRSKKTTRKWHVWEPVIKSLEALISTQESEHAAAALRCLGDLIKSDNQSEGYQ